MNVQSELTTCSRADAAYLSAGETHRMLAAADSARYTWYVIGLLSVVNVFNFMDRVALSVLLPYIKADLELSDAQLGLLIGFAFALFYAICGIPIARWADRGTRRNIIAVTLTVWSVMTALCGAAHNFWQLLGARVGVGAGEAGCLPAAQSIICDYVPPERRAVAYAVHSFGLVAGMMVGMALAGWLGELIGWRWTFVVLGLPGIAIAVVVRLTLREPVRGFFDVMEPGAAALPFGATVRQLWHCRTYRLIVLFLLLNGFVVYGLTQWWPSLYARVFGLNLSSVGVYLGLAIGAGQGTGLLIGGLLANKAGRHDARLPLQVGAAAIALSLPIVVVSLFVPSAHASILLVLLAGLLWSVSNGPVVAALYGSVAPAMRATGGALSIFLTSVLGLGLGPLFVGLLSDLLAPSLGVESLRYALLVPTALLPAMVFALFTVARSLPVRLRPAGVHDRESDQ